MSQRVELVTLAERKGRGLTTREGERAEWLLNELASYGCALDGE